MKLNPDLTREIIWLDYNGYKLGSNQSQLTPIQSIFLVKGHMELYEEMNKVD